MANSVRLLEDQLEHSRNRLRGQALEIDALRRYHRQILQELRVGVCAFGPDDEACLAQNLRYENERAVIDESAHQILEQTRRISDIGQTLMSFSHSRKTAEH